MKAFSSAFVATILACTGVNASAAFVDQDLSLPGDNLLTLDTSTHLQWLDINATSGLTFENIELGAGGWTSLGFRSATRPEIEQLFHNAGLELGPPRDSTKTPGVELLISHLGCNLCYLGSSLRGGSVLYGDSILAKDGLLGHATFTVDVYGEGFGSVDDTWAKAWDLGSSNLTTILVRTSSASAVPEPSALLLLSAGVISTVALKRSRRAIHSA